ncbi:zinc-finger-containing protein [Parapedobacter indicus]|uniref:Uncharacterized protein n=1 Tax=Parapedobacter indicus TaxID=1477437 RepID=A0A1I3E4L1_9SPHI|nr:zinc-finger-containing protein [Parapedobacter indicus]PPL04968.1 uncharacterized protein DUF3268 [Parapedobacter indicus]SFH93962.1 Protein of unknown function [Parapedobacter indicus]
METLTITPNIKLINKGLICPYCGGKTKLTNEQRYFAGKYSSPVWACEPCFAWVGVFKGTTVAYGRVANHALREARWYITYYFDTIWKNGHMPKAQAYRWMAKKLGITQKDFRIGWLDLKQCQKVIEVSKKFLNI